MNVPLAWIVSALVGGGVVYLLTRSSVAAPPQAPVCTIDADRFQNWAGAEGYTSVYLAAPPPPPSIAELAQTFTLLKSLSPSQQVVVVCSDGSFWYYENLTATPVRRDNLRAQYCSTQKTLGDPASAFLL